MNYICFYILQKYLKKSLDHKVLNNLNALEDEFETLWIEINTGPKSKNIIVCCAYQHPDTDASKFTVYQKQLYQKWIKIKLYKKFRNKVVTEIRKSRNDYHADYFTKHKKPT